MSNHGSNTPLRVSSDDWAEFVNAGKSLLKRRNKMQNNMTDKQHREYVHTLTEMLGKVVRVHGKDSAQASSMLSIFLAEVDNYVNREEEQNERRD